jgi:hypothetical protein
VVRELFLREVVDEATDEHLHMRLVEPIGERGDQADADDLIVELHATDRRRCRLFAFEQAGPIASVANDIETPVGDRSVEVRKIHLGGPARNQIDEQRMYDIDRILAVTQDALGFTN